MYFNVTFSIFITFNYQYSIIFIKFLQYNNLLKNSVIFIKNANCQIEYEDENPYNLEYFMKVELSLIYQGY